MSILIHFLLKLRLLFKSYKETTLIILKMNFEIRNISILVVKIILCFKISQNVILGIHDLELPHK